MKLMHRNELEAEDASEAVLSQSFRECQSQLKPPFPTALLNHQQYAKLTEALLFAILTSPDTSNVHLTQLKLIVTDGYSSFVRLLTRLVTESYPKLLQHAKHQVIWIFRQLVDLSANDCEFLALALLRRIQCGDNSNSNLWLALEVLYTFQSNAVWLKRNHYGILSYAVFTYLRLLSDHCRFKGNQMTNVLKKSETEFCVRVLRGCFADCMAIGRDLVRLLQDLTSIPEFEKLWKDLVGNPRSLGVSGFADISQLLLMRTSSRYHVSRVTPEMETRLRFLLSHVKWGFQRRYLEWFANKFLVGPESETLIPDLIRFICCAHHPSNEILQSDVIPRWAVIGWLLKSCRMKYTEASAKLSLFYDWLFFNESVDNIMNIEPAILLMVHSLPKYVDMTQSLLDFLLHLIDHYDPQRKDLVRRGVSASFDILVKKGVVPSVEPLLSCQLIAPFLRDKLAAFLFSSQPSTNKNVASCFEETNFNLVTGTCAKTATSSEPLVLIPKSTPLPSKSIALCSADLTSTTKTNATIAKLPTLSETPGSVQKATLAFPSRLAALARLDMITTNPVTDDASNEVKPPSSEPIPVVQISSCPPPTKSGSLFRTDFMTSNSITSDVSPAKKVMSSDSLVLVQHSLPSLPANSVALSTMGLVTSNEVRGNGASMQQQRKRRCVEAPYILEINKIVELLKDSTDARHMGLEMLENFFLQFVGICMKEADNTLDNSSMETARNIASTLSSALDAGGEKLFSPLNIDSDDAADNEVASATAVVLCMNALFCHPKMLTMLLYWAQEGFAVGSRMLCYASRLADEFDQFSSLRAMTDQSANYINTLQMVDINGKENDVKSTGICTDTDVTENELLQRFSLLRTHSDKFQKYSRAKESPFKTPECFAKDGLEHLPVIVEGSFAAYRRFLNARQGISTVVCLKGNEIDISRGETSDAPSGAEMSDGKRDALGLFLEDLQCCCFWNTNRAFPLFRSIFRHLPDLSTGQNHVIKLLVSLLVPAEILILEKKLIMQEFSIFGKNPEVLSNILRESLEWEPMEQKVLWQLFVSDYHAQNLLATKSLLSFCAKNLDPSLHAMAISGLLIFLRCQSPSAELVKSVLCLPIKFADFAAHVIVSWSSSHFSKLLVGLNDCMKDLLPSVQRTTDVTNYSWKENINLPTVYGILSILDKHRLTKGSYILDIKIILSELAYTVGRGTKINTKK